MFGRIFLETDFERAIDNYVQAIESGHYIDSTDIDLGFATNSKAARDMFLEKHLSQEPSRKSVFICYLACHLKTLTDLAAKHFESALNSPDLVHFAWQTFSGLDEFPEAILARVREELKETGDDFLDVAIASCAIQLPPPQNIEAIRVLRNALDQADNDAKVLAAAGLARAKVQTKQIGEQLAQILIACPEAVVVLIVRRLNNSFQVCPELLNILLSIASDESKDSGVRAYCLSKLGEVFPHNQEVNELLRTNLMSQEWGLVVHAGLGLMKQDIPVPGSVLTELVERLNFEDVESRHAAASVLADSGQLLDESHVEHVVAHIESEPTEAVNEKLIWCLIGAGPKAIAPVLRRASKAEGFRVGLWHALLQQFLKRYPSDFPGIYEEERTDRLDEQMPSILSQVAYFDPAIVAQLRAALSGECPVSRSNALLSLSSCDHRMAMLSPELIRLAIAGSESEAIQAEAVILRFGDASHPYLAEFDGLEGEEQALKLTRLQRLVRFEEGAIVDAELVGISSLLIRRFVLCAQLIPVVGSYKQIEQGIEDLDSVPEKLRMGERTLSTNTKNLEKTLAEATHRPQQIRLIDAKPAGSTLTEDGEYWLARFRKYLDRIGFKDELPADLVASVQEQLAMKEND